VAQVNDQWQRQLDKAFFEQCDDFDRRLTQIERDKYADTETQRTKLGDYKESLRRWESGSNHVSPALLPRTTTLRERLVALEKALQQQEQEQRDAKQITTTVGDIPTFVKALQGYVQNSPRAERTADLKRVLEESLWWQAVADWDKFTAHWHQTGIAGFRGAAAGEQLALANAVSDAFGDSAECSSLRQLLPYLKAIARRDNGGERIEVPLKMLFADPLVANVWMVECHDGQRFYVNEQPVLGADANPFHYVITFNGKTRPGVLRRNDVKQVARAPQVAVAEQVQPILNSLDDNNWETSFCQVIAVIHAERAMDPILKINLLRQVLEVGSRGSYCLEKAFGRHLAWVKDAGINPFANWLDPTDAAAARSRKLAAEKWDSFPEVEESRKAAEKDLALLRRLRLAEFRWVGWLRRTKDGRWECAMNRAPDGGGPLLVVHRPSSGGKPVLARAGRFDGKTASVDAAVPSVLVEGRPVYLAVP